MISKATTDGPRIGLIRRIKADFFPIRTDSPNPRRPRSIAVTRHGFHRFLAMRGRVLWLMGALLLYLALSLYQLGLPGLHYDEAKDHLLLVSRHYLLQQKLR